MKEIDRRTFLKGMGVLGGTTLGLGAFSVFETRGAQAKIILGLASVNVAFLPIYVTQEKGFFNDEGLEVLLVMFNAGNTAVQALVGGDLQIMGASVVDAVVGRATGIDITNFWGVCNLMPFQLYSQPNFRSMKDARGKKFAISRFGSLSDFLTRASLLHFGIDSKEVAILQIGSTPARFAALSAGSVDASVMWFPVTEMAKAQGFIKLFDLKDIFPEWPFETFAARESWLAKEKTQVVKFLRAYQRGVKYTHENKEEAVRIIRKYVKMEAVYAPAGYDQYRDSFPVNGKIAEKGISLVIEQEFKAGSIKKKISLEEVVDRSFINLLGGK